MFRGPNQKKHALAITTRRVYYHLTGDEVQQVNPEELVIARAVKTFKGGIFSWVVTAMINFKFWKVFLSTNKRTHWESPIDCW